MSVSMGMRSLSGVITRLRAPVMNTLRHAPSPFYQVPRSTLVASAAPMMHSQTVFSPRFHSIRPFSSATASEPSVMRGYYSAEQQAAYLNRSSGDHSKRTFAYFVLTAGRFTYSAAVRLVVLRFIYSMSASADVLALASAEVDISSLAEGSSMTVKWRGKPVFIRHRTDDEIELANSVTISDLRHPESDSDRVQNPKYLVLLGVCTHLGCVPIGESGDFSGWFCPCHGSHYDTSGRIRKGPAPYNLEVPTYKFVDDSTLLIG